MTEDYMKEIDTIYKNALNPESITSEEKNY